MISFGGGHVLLHCCCNDPLVTGGSTHLPSCHSPNWRSVASRIWRARSFCCFRRACLARPVLIVALRMLLAAFMHLVFADPGRAKLTRLADIGVRKTFAVEHFCTASGEPMRGIAFVLARTIAMASRVRVSRRAKICATPCASAMSAAAAALFVVYVGASGASILGGGGAPD